MTMQSAKSNKPPAPKKPRHAPLPVIRLRINELRVEHGFPFTMDLWKQLQAMGMEISYSRLTRILNNQADVLDKNLLAAFTVIFHCTVQDLFA